LLVSVGQETTLAAAERRLAALLDSGAAHEKFQHMVSAQGGKLEHLPARAPTHELLSPRDGYVVAIDTEALGYALIELGGGRKQLGDPLDHTVGLECCVKRNEFVARDAPLLQVFARSDGFERVREALIAAFTLEDEPGPLTPLIVERRESAP
jgi:thymidine phosphorylase